MPINITYTPYVPQQRSVQVIPGEHCHIVKRTGANYRAQFEAIIFGNRVSVPGSLRTSEETCALVKGICLAIQLNMKKCHL